MASAGCARGSSELADGLVIAHLSPGTGHYHCGTCVRDGALVRALRRRGHDAWIAPLYLPLFPALEGARESPRVLMGALNIYLQHKLPLFGRLPRWIADRLDAPRLLRWLARRGGATRAQELGAMTVAMLRGEQGPLAREVDKLATWLEERGRLDLLCLSNVLLAGLAPALRARPGVPLVCSLQGEAAFLDALPEPYREQAWELLRERAAAIDVFIAVSEWYGGEMSARLGLAPGRVRTVHNGIELAELTPAAAPTETRRPALGYLARLCRDKGVHTLVEAFVLLKRNPRLDALVLRLAGVELREDRPLVAKLRARLRAAGLEKAVEIQPNLEESAKARFLSSLAVFSVPATYGEAFGLYVVEALAAGVPVVQPRCGAFEELLEASGGGLLCEPDDPAALAAGIERLLLDEELRGRLARRGRAAVLEHFSADRMARDFEEVCRGCLRARSGQGC